MEQFKGINGHYQALVGMYKKNNSNKQSHSVDANSLDDPLKFDIKSPDTKWQGAGDDTYMDKAMQVTPDELIKVMKEIMDNFR